MLSISEEIKQSRFKSEQQKAMLNIMLTANTIYARNNRFLKQFGLSPEQYNVLRILRGISPDGCSVINIQERMLDKMSNASRLIDKLELKKLVFRCQAAVDRRQLQITITQSGLDLLETIDPPFEKIESQIVKFPNEDLERFNTMLDSLRNSYRDSAAD